MSRGWPATPHRPNSGPQWVAIRRPWPEYAPEAAAPVGRRWDGFSLSPLHARRPGPSQRARPPTFEELFAGTAELEQPELEDHAELERECFEASWTRAASLDDFDGGGAERVRASPAAVPASDVFLTRPRSYASLPPSRPPAWLPLARRLELSQVAF